MKTAAAKETRAAAVELSTTVAAVLCLTALPKQYLIQAAVRELTQAAFHWKTALWMKRRTVA
jgi:hypothetical protein